MSFTLSAKLDHDVVDDGLQPHSSMFMNRRHQEYNSRIADGASTNADVTNKQNLVKGTSKSKNKGKSKKVRNYGRGQGYFDMKAFFQVEHKVGKGINQKKDKNSKRTVTRLHLRDGNRCPLCYQSLLNDDHKRNHFSKCIFGAKSKHGGNADVDTDTGTNAGTNTGTDAGTDTGTNADTDTGADTTNNRGAGQNETDSDRWPNSTDLFTIWRKFHYRRRLNYSYFKNRFVQKEFSQNFAQLRPILEREIMLRLENDIHIKIGLQTSVLFAKQIDTNDDELDFSFHRIEYIFTGLIEIISPDQISDVIDHFESTTLATIESYLKNGSNFTVQSILLYRLESIKLNGMAARRVQALPTFVPAKHVIQIYNQQRECILLSIALHLALQERYRAFPKSQWSKLLPHCLNDNQLEFLCGNIYEDLFAKSKHLFPLKTGKKNFEKLQSVLQLNEMFFNVLWANDGDIFTVYASLGKTDFKGSNEAEKLQDFEQNSLDLLIFNEQPSKLIDTIFFGHCALVTNLSAIVDRIKNRQQKHAHYYCRFCSSHFRTNKRCDFLIHLKNCKSMNTHFQTIKIPKACNHPNKPSEPEIVVNETTGKQSVPYFVSADLEIAFCKEENSEQKLSDGQMLNEECFAMIMSGCISSLMEPSIYDTAEIRELKTHFFPPVVTSGQFAVYDGIVKLMDQCHVAKKNLDIITNHFKHCRLTDIEREIVQQTTKCQNPICNYTFLERSEMNLDHDHLGSEGYKGQGQDFDYNGHGGGLRRILCHR